MAPGNRAGRTAVTFKALMLRETEGRVAAAVEDVPEPALPEGDVTVRVACSSLNYKDGMVVLGKGRLVRRYPHIPGVDLAGEVESSDDPRYRPGDRVVLTGWRVGETHWGGYAQRARVRGDWLVPCPPPLDPFDAMAIGTAGYSAMLGVMALEAHGLKPGDGEVLVTGASGGVGSVAVMLLAARGHRVVASTGRAELAESLRALGAAEVIGRDALGPDNPRPLETERWAGCIDSVGQPALPKILAQLRARASVAAIGLAGGSELHTTVIPFLLRGVNLLGIDSVMSPPEERRAAWQRLGREIDRDRLRTLTRRVGLAEVPRLAKDILAGHVHGRVVVVPD